MLINILDYCGPKSSVYLRPEKDRNDSSLTDAILACLYCVSIFLLQRQRIVIFSRERNMTKNDVVVFGRWTEMQIVIKSEPMDKLQRVSYLHGIVLEFKWIPSNILQCSVCL